MIFHSLTLVFGVFEMGFSVAASVMVAKHWNSCGVVQQLNNMLIGKLQVVIPYTCMYGI